MRQKSEVQTDEGEVAGKFSKRPISPDFWAGIGASAGGPEALRGLVRSLPSDVSATHIVVQHLAQQHRSMPVQIIGRKTGLSVLDVTDGLPPAANILYVTPPNYNIVVDDGCLRLVEPSREPAAPKPSVDLSCKLPARPITNG